jgi:tetratricopeptide (TPR) repeat protein
MHELYQQGIASLEAGDLEGAIVSFDEILQLQPDFTEAYYKRGLARFKRHDSQGAIADYTRALLSDDKNASAYYARSLAYLSVGSLEGAIADVKQAILIKPDSAAAYNLLGTVRQRQGATEKAIASYKKAAELYLDQQDIFNCRRCLEALRQLQPTSSVSPNSAKSAFLPLLTPNEFLQQAVEKAKQNYWGALEDLDWAVQLDPQNVQAYSYRGQIKEKWGDNQGAIEDYRQAAKLFLAQADQGMAQKMIEAVDRIKTTQAQTVQAQTVRTYPVNPARVTHRPPTGPLSREVQDKLLRLVGDDRKIASGLVERLKQKHPGMPEDWYWEKAIYDLGRDRR